MDEQKINSLFEIATDFAIRTYKEVFNQYPDTSQLDTNKILEMLMQAWLTGFNYFINDNELLNVIIKTFGFYAESE